MGPSTYYPSSIRLLKSVIYESRSNSSFLPENSTSLETKHQISTLYFGFCSYLFLDLKQNRSLIFDGFFV